MNFYEPICGNCARTMICKTNGITAVWNYTHRRRGDLYICPECGASVLRANSSAYHGTEPLDPNRSIEMRD